MTATEVCPLCGNPLGSGDCYRRIRVFLDGPPTYPLSEVAEEFGVDLSDEEN